MKGFQTIEADLLRQVLHLNQNQLLQVMSDVLRDKYKNVVQSSEYVIAEGDIPIALVAHVDTVFPYPPHKVYYDREENVMWSPTGAGFDDRAGVFMILQILQHTKLRPHIILTTGEEKGGVGAFALVDRFEHCPFNELKYVIQLDRRGANDCVFYDCINRDFINYISSFGFVERIGSFSDISFICPCWSVCGVNLSVGYYDEHTTSETLCVSDYFNTLQKVKKMLMANDIPNFEWMERPTRYISTYTSLSDDDDFDFASGFEVLCKGCHKVFSNYETIPVKMLDGSTSFYCVDCLAKAPVSWCDECGEAFEAISPDSNYCNDCIEKVKYEQV